MFYTEYEKDTSRDIDKRTMNDKPLEQETYSDVQKEIALMIKLLDDIYKNKSSDEYNMMGDITKSKVYDELEKQIANLRTLKNFPPQEANDYQKMFINSYDSNHCIICSSIEVVFHNLNKMIIQY